MPRGRCGHARFRGPGPTHTTNEQRVRAGAGQASVCTDSEWCTPDSRREGGGDAANANAPAEPSQGQCHTQTGEQTVEARGERHTYLSPRASRAASPVAYANAPAQTEARARSNQIRAVCARSDGVVRAQRSEECGLDEWAQPCCSRSRKNRRGASASTTSYR